MKFRSSLDKYRRGKPASPGKKSATVNIDSLSNEGDGVARVNGQAVFVPNTAPGDSVQIRLTEQHKNWARAELLSVDVESPSRVTPKCEYFEQCGGCTWQHLKYEAQLSAKTAQLADTLKRIGGIVDLDIREIVISPNPYGYRNRIRGVIENGEFHFHGNRSNERIAVTSCVIADERINRFLGESIAYDATSPAPVELAIVQDQVEVFPIQSDRTTELGFRQVNDAVSMQLTAAVEEIISADLAKQAPSTPSAPLYDLYCGHGTWSIQIANTHPTLKVVGVDVLEDNIRIARQRGSAIKNVSFIHQRAEKAVTQISQAPGFIIVDPPRAGLSNELIEALKGIQLSTLIYISCHPATLARDLALLQSGSYRIDYVQPFDMFPQTPHVETLAVLRGDS